MFCPRCAHEQSAPELRYCPRCGMALAAVAELIHTDGIPPPAVAAHEEIISPRRQGVRQGSVLIFIGAVLIPLLAMMNAPEELAGVVAVLTFLLGFLRILYSAMFLSPAPAKSLSPKTDKRLPFFKSKTQTPAALPPPSSARITPLAQRTTTGELIRPASVTESTTRLLDK